MVMDVQCNPMYNSLDYKGQMYLTCRVIVAGLVSGIRVSYKLSYLWQTNNTSVQLCNVDCVCVCVCTPEIAALFGWVISLEEMDFD